MRADNDQVIENSVESCKDECKADLKMAENGKNNNNVCELFYDTRSGDEWDKENDLERHSCGGDSIESGKKQQEHSNVDSVDPVFFMDKNVTVCDLPEIVVCYKENTYHVVKDICVDEGVPVHEKFLFGDKDSVKCSSEDDLMKEDNTNVNHLALKESNSKVDDYKKDLCAEGASSCNQEHLIVTEEVQDLATTGLNSSEIFLEFESNENLKKNEVDTSENGIKESLTLGDILLREDEQKSLNRPEEQSPSPQLQEEKEPTFLETEEKLPSVSTTTSQEEPDKTCNDPEKLLTSGFGETSFSASEPISISGHITYAGPIAFSGSLSVRSDASTTSGRSFAFPILQSEWNSSPVRMAKADKRRPKGWRHTLLCCRFS